VNGLYVLDLEDKLVCNINMKRVQLNDLNPTFIWQCRLGHINEKHIESDEDITTPKVVTYNSEVKLFFSIIIFNASDEWTLHQDMCSMSFTKVPTWIKEGVDPAWKGWIMKHLDWGPNPSAPYASTRSPHYLWYKETRRPILIRFGKVDSDSRNSPHQNHQRDHIWTPFWTFFIWMKR
jgi:hypothetical protein